MASLRLEVKSGTITLSGSQAKFDQFLSVFDSFDDWYIVVTPVDAK